MLYVSRTTPAWNVIGSGGAPAIKCDIVVRGQTRVFSADHHRCTDYLGCAWFIGQRWN